MSQRNPTWEVQFLGSPTPIIGLKLNSRSEDTIWRYHAEFLEQAYWLNYHYYFQGLKEPLDHRDVEVSVFLTRLSKLVGSNDGFIFLRSNYERGIKHNQDNAGEQTRGPDDERTGSSVQTA